MKPTKQCSYCGKYFTPNGNKQLCCSLSCGVKLGWQKHPAKFRAKKPNKLRQLVPCAYCGKLVSRYPCQLKNGGLSFCSKECEGKYRSPIYKRQYPNGFHGNVGGWHHSEKTKAKLKKIMNSPEVREKIASKLRGERNPFFGRHHTVESIEQGNKGRMEWLNNPDNRKRCLEGSFKGWLTLTKQLQKYLKDGLPNPSERKLQDIIEECYPNQYKYNNGWFQLGGKFPDFVNINGEKKVIELFGEVYHKPAEVNKKQDFYRQFGWHCLIIWAKELSDRERVKERIRSFAERI